MVFKDLMLFSSNLEKQKEFYTNKLGFEQKEQGLDFFIIEAGVTKLKFVQNNEATPYHFAFNIPSNKGAEALSWLKERVDILDFEGSELVDFTDWNAEAMYFYDADNNIVEFIARKNMDINVDALFSIQQILSVSEIGIPTSDVKVLFNSIQQYFPISVYSGELVRFAALGDEQGLFIVINEQTKKWIPRNDFPYRSEFELVLSFENKIFNLNCKNGFIKLQQ